MKSCIKKQVEMLEISIYRSLVFPFIKWKDVIKKKIIVAPKGYIEYFIIDGASTDNTEAIVRSYIEQRVYGESCGRLVYYLTGDCINHQAVFAHMSCFDKALFDMEHYRIWRTESGCCG